MSLPVPATPLRVLLFCSGTGIFNRGIESFFDEAFAGLHGTPGLDVHMLQGGPLPPGHPPERHRMRVIPRTGKAAALLGKALRRSPYTVEQLSGIPGTISFLREYRPDVLLYSDMNIMMRLNRMRGRWGVPMFRGIYSNGAPMHPPFRGQDLVQQVVPAYYDEAIAAGEPPERHMMVPYGITVPDGDPALDPASRTELRRKLGLPTGRPVVLSVGRIAAEHKRMHHMVAEVAAIPKSDRPFLMMLGAIDEATAEIRRLAEDKLGKEGDAFLCRSVPYEQVGDYYRCADAFALCSVKEGFGRVYIESLVNGLPTVAHDDPVMRFVVADAGTIVSMEKPGELADALTRHLREGLDAASMARRRESVRSRFSWKVLAPAYRDMFLRAHLHPCTRTDR